MDKTIKTFADIEKIRHAISIWQKVKADLTEHAKVGTSLLELDELAREKIIAYGGFPTFYRQYGFPGNICISVNECVIHGVPTDYKLKEGDKVSFDVGVTYQDHICDACFTLIIGHNKEAEKISQVCREAIDVAANMIKPGVTNLQVAKAIEDFVRSHGYYLLHDFTGHGCGNALHEDPMMPNYYSKDFEEVALKENMVLCIEPMILSKSPDYYINPINGWDVIARNKKLTCHWEDMILVTHNGCEILTRKEQ